MPLHAKQLSSFNLVRCVGNSKKPDVFFISFIYRHLHLRVSLFNQISALIDEGKFQQLSLFLF